MYPVPGAQCEPTGEQGPGPPQPPRLPLRQPPAAQDHSLPHLRSEGNGPELNVWKETARKW